MPNLISSVEGTIARMGSQLGVRWPNPWWPAGKSTYDDCAAFVSWALWGLNGRQPFQTIVSGIIERSGLQFRAGNGGIRRGDLLGFRWSTKVNYDHIEVALGSPDRNGNVKTIGTNAGPGDNVAIRTRPIRYVHNYARPAYSSTAGGGAKPIDDEGEHEMKLITHPNGQPAVIGEFTFLQVAASTMADLEPIYGPHIPVSADAWTFLDQRIGYNRALFASGDPASAPNLEMVKTALRGLLPELAQAVRDEIIAKDE